MVKCILWPGTKIVITSGTLKQANEVLLKVKEIFMPKSAILRSEIKECNIGQNNAEIIFWNGSEMTTRTSNPNARSARANIIICDEFRMVDKTIIDQVIRKFLADPRHPGYVDRPEYKHLRERNQEIYMSSAWMKSHWSWEKAQSYTADFFNDKTKYFICGLPYQLSIKEGLLMKSQISDEMSEADFDPIAFSMEMECMWLGDTDGNLFKYDDLDKRRILYSNFHDLSLYDDKYHVPALLHAEERILSVDVALMASNKKKKNDASAIFINSAIQKDEKSYEANFVYAETFEGLTTDQLGIIVMRYFYKYKCTQLVLDTNGIGLGVYDFICKDQYDPETGETYNALSCCNDNDMASRCKVIGAKKVVWSVKATSAFNNEICVLLRNGIANGKVKFLMNEQLGEDRLSDKTKGYKGYDKLSLTQQTILKMPYVQTTMAIFELVKLDHEIKNGQIKVKEISGMRKDRYSSLAYSYWCMMQLEYQLKPKMKGVDLLSQFIIRPASRARSY